MGKNRILAACIIAAFVLLLLAIIYRQQGEIDRLTREPERAKETMGRIIDENNALKGRVIELSERCTENNGESNAY
ncbi:MAG: hypothetical protein GY847_28405 [Proteobacteria bacterium]|nr:hypothetical protein [Pseudomonadota bacterium]